MQLAPGSGYWYWFSRSAAMNWSMRGSLASASLSWWPQDCSEIGWSSPGNGVISMYGWPSTLLRSVSSASPVTWSGL
ncbi:hypothetical protein BJF90_17105 [Pseudonocardia sp. CNS-004]|nr:hypothetical protein BJF90_17105 [Pseudonocardia sp. CNS-004]